MADEIKVPMGMQKQAVRDHLSAVAGKALPDGSSDPVRMDEGEVRAPWDAAERIAARREAAEGAAKAPPQEMPQEQAQPKEEPKVESPPAETPQPDAESPPQTPKVDARLAEMAKHKAKIEEDYATLKKEVEELRKQQPVQPAERPENWDELTEDEQIDMMVEHRINQRLEGILPTLQTLHDHQRVRAELGVDLSDSQLAAVNAIWQGGSSTVTAQEAAALAASRNPELFGASVGVESTASRGAAEAPSKPSPNREPKDQGKELRERLTRAGPSGRQAAGVALMKHLMQGAVERRS